MLHAITIDQTFFILSIFRESVKIIELIRKLINFQVLECRKLVETSFPLMLRLVNKVSSLSLSSSLNKQVNTHRKLKSTT